ncbi:MAG TPA: methyltransferase domain-containing protein [Alloacidobacterium sp.]|nr:methyltransferase domain-containing protein [Alloacidobacterium sp.]
MLRSLFSRGQSEEQGRKPTLLSGPRMPRHSSGWSALLKHLKAEPSLCVLDIGPTSPSNINHLTSMGHSVWMADVVHEALKGGFELPPAEGSSEASFDVAGFFEQNLNFSGRQFDVVLLWTTLDYIPDGLIAPLIEHLHQAVRPGGRILALFHTRQNGPETAFCRYHITDGETIEMQESAPFPIRRVYTNRNIEKLFSAFSNYRFFLAKDNLYEVIITR